MENNKDYVLKSSLELDGKHICDITYKPKTTLVISLVCGLLFIATLNIYCVILGAFMLLYVVFVAKTVKDYPIISLYDTYMLIYELESYDMVRRINYVDIEEWTCKDTKGQNNCVRFKLIDGENIYKDTFQTSKAYSELNKLIPEKESLAIKHARQKDIKMKFKFKLPFKFKK